MYIKNSCKALIVKDGKLLLNRCGGGDGVYYVLPGGGQRCGETMEETVIRECAEETGYRVRVLRPVGMGERIWDGLHKVYNIFLCEAIGEAAEATNTDINQEGAEWVDVSSTPRVYPIMIRRRLNEMLTGSYVYLGSERNGAEMIDRGSITVKYLQEYIKSKDFHDDADNIYFVKLTEELGELARVIVRGCAHADENGFKNTLEEELWDVMYYVLALANVYDIDLERWIPIKEAYNNLRYHPGLRFDPEEWSLLKDK